MNENVISYDRLMQICRAYINDDSDACETGGGTLDPVRHRLTDVCECTAEEIEALGFSWMFFEEEENAQY